MESTPVANPDAPEEEPFDAETYKKDCDKKLPLLKQQLAWAIESFEGDFDRTEKVKSEEKNWRELKAYNKDPPVEWV